MEFRFGTFTLSPERFELCSDGVPVPVEPQVFHLLCHLVANRDRMVSRDEVVRKVWGGRAISDAAIASRVKSARSAVGDDGVRQAVIRTIHGQGFRFVAPVVLAVSALPTSTPLQTAAQGKPSVAVLPLQPLGLRPEQSFLGDAIAHELIQVLSKLRWLTVIARGTSFRFANPIPDLVAAGSAMDVRYLVFGTVEAEGARLAVTVELSDSKRGEVIWADRFAEADAGVFGLRAMIASGIVAALETHIPLNEAREASLGGSQHLDAWANYHLGLRHMYQFTEAETAHAAGYFNRAVELDPGFARAHAGLSFTAFQRAFMNYGAAPGAAVHEARAHAERGMALDPLDPFTNFTLGRSFWLTGDIDAAGEWLGRATELNPNYAQGFYARGFTDMLAGRPDAAVQGSQTALRLSPLDPLRYAMLGISAMSQFQRGDYAAAADWADRAARAPGAHYLISMIALASNTMADRPEQAQHWAEDIRRRRPNASAQQFHHAFPFADPEVRARFDRAFRAHGMAGD